MSNKPAGKNAGFSLESGESAASQDDSEKSLSDIAYHRLKHAIISCELLPGASYTENQLSERYALGKAPVRNGLLRLCHEGLIDSQARKGYVIAPVTYRDVQEIFQLRLFLEPQAARAAAGRLTEPLARRLMSTLQVAHVPGDKESDADFLNANKVFHVTIAAATGNQRLVEIIDRLLDEMKRLLHLGLALHPRGQHFQEEHAELLKLLLAGDAKKAEELTYEQIKGGQEMVLDSILNNSAGINGDFMAAWRRD